MKYKFEVNINSTYNLEIKLNVFVLSSKVSVLLCQISPSQTGYIVSSKIGLS